MGEAKTPAELTAEQLAAVRALLGERDCGDNSCMLRYPRGVAGGMRTNGGCRCLERDREAQRTAWRLHQAAALLLEEVTRLRAERAAEAALAALDADQPKSEEADDV